MLKSLWASVIDNPVAMRKFNGWATIFWIAMIPVSIYFDLLSLVQYVSALSLWALVSGHLSAWQAARVEVKQDEQQQQRDNEELTVPIFRRPGSGGSGGDGGALVEGAMRFRNEWSGPSIIGARNFSSGSIPEGWEQSGGWTVVDSTDVSTGLTKGLMPPDIGHSQSTWIEYTATCLEGSGSARVWPSSETNYDKLNLSINGINVQSWTGVQGQSELKTFSVPAGVNTIRFTYVKDEAGNQGGDTCIIFEVTVPEIDPSSPGGDYLVGDVVTYTGAAWLAIEDAGTTMPEDTATVWQKLA